MRQLTAVAIAGICVLAAACGGNTEKSSTPTTTSAPPPVAVNALEGLQLPSAAINTAMGAKDMAVAVAYDKMTDVTAELSDNAKDCAMVVLPAQRPVYTDSRWTAVRGQRLREPGHDFSHTVDQAVVSFPAAADAAAFYRASGKRWAACSDRNYTRTPRGEPAQKWTTQTATNTNGTLSIRRPQEGGNGWTCQRALTVRNNVAVDVMACGYAPGDFGVNIAHQIAGKVAPH